MLVRNWMSKKVVTIDVNDSMMDATALLKKHNIHMLPVMKQGKLVGILTDRDIKRASASDASTLEIHELLYLVSQIKVEQIMTRNPITVPEQFTMEETAEILLSNKISGVPVMNKDEKVVGIITKSDLFRMFISVTGIGKRGIQFAFQLEDRPGSIKEVTDILRRYGGRLASILSSYDRVPEGYRNAYVRIYQLDRSRLEELKKELREKAKVLYMVDHKEDRREIYT